MVYDPDKQYRCTIIRGRSKSEMDDLLPIYGSIIDDTCPCKKDKFDVDFNNKLKRHISSPTKKTLDNHRTEITGKLFGMWYVDDQSIVHSSKRTINLLKNRDQPAFFKEIVWNFQFPNGLDKLQTIKDRMDNKIRIRIFAFTLKFILEMKKKEMIPTKNELAYYIFNNLDVLQGKATIEEVLDEIIARRKLKIFKKVEHDNKASSYSMQHISELLNILELANLIKQEHQHDVTLIKLNNNEDEFVSKIASNKKLFFDMYDYDINDSNDVKKMYHYWNEYYSNCSAEQEILKTTSYKLSGFSDELREKIMETIFEISDNFEPKKESENYPVSHIQKSAGDIGDEGENIVLVYEKNRVKKFLPRLVNKVIHFGKQRGLGYDISSIIAENPHPEHAIFIEVKTTFRVTIPKNNFKDSFDLTRNEWIAAEQYRNNFFVYRVYLTNQGAYLFKIKDLLTLKENNKIYAVPLKYHVEFETKMDDEQWIKI